MNASYDSITRKPVSIALVGLAIAAPSVMADDAEHLSAESRALFSTVLADEAPPSGHCRYDSAWQNDVVPEDIARKYLGSTLHADLVAPQHTGDLQSTLDPTNQQPDAFCNETELAEYEETRFQAMKKDASASRMEIITQYFTFPVFDGDFRTAIVIVTGKRDTWQRADRQIGIFKRGDVGRFPPDIASVAQVFRKTPKGWALIASEPISQT